MAWTYDATVLASAAMESDSVQPARRILIVVGDSGLEGEEASPFNMRGQPAQAGRMSKATYKDALEVAQRSNTTIFGVSGGRSLYLFTKETGGYFWALIGPGGEPKPSSNIWAEFPLAFENIRAQTEYMYSVTYTPANPGQPGKLREIKLKMIPSERKWKVVSPKSYVIRASSNLNDLSPPITH
jgi:hypothetical protein